MDAQKIAVARACLAGAYDQSMDFPAILGALNGAGFEGYSVDYRRNAATYYLVSGGCIDLPLPGAEHEVAAEFAADRVKAFIRGAQTNSEGYSYESFCRKVTAAGCASYLVSLSGRRVVYFGRTGETHVEHMPAS